MSKYEKLLTDVFSIFETASWKSQEVKTYPSNFLAMNAGNEFIRVSVIPSGNSLNLLSISGVLLIDIFTATGKGPKRAFVIADKLDEQLVGKAVRTASKTNVQFGSSSLGASSVDYDNPALSRAVYTLPFNYFGAY